MLTYGVNFSSMSTMKFIHPKNIDNKIIDKYKGHCVESVYLTKHRGGGLEWDGSLVGENFFKIGYLNGILCINICDRESRLYDDGHVIGNLKDHNTPSLNSIDDLIKFISSYDDNESNITFDDVLEFLEWTKTETFQIIESID